MRKIDFELLIDIEYYLNLGECPHKEVERKASSHYPNYKLERAEWKVADRLFERALKWLDENIDRDPLKGKYAVARAHLLTGGCPEMVTRHDVFYWCREVRGQFGGMVLDDIRARRRLLEATEAFNKKVGHRVLTASRSREGRRPGGGRVFVEKIASIQETLAAFREDKMSLEDAARVWKALSRDGQIKVGTDLKMNPKFFLELVIRNEDYEILFQRPDTPWRFIQEWIDSHTPMGWKREQEVFELYVKVLKRRDCPDDLKAFVKETNPVLYSHGGGKFSPADFWNMFQEDRRAFEYFLLESMVSIREVPPSLLLKVFRSTKNRRLRNLIRDRWPSGA